MTTFKPEQVADWMVREMEAGNGMLMQETAVFGIAQLFGLDFIVVSWTFQNSIHPSVLKAFRRMTPNVVWVNAGKYWRIRLPHDPPGRRQA